MFKGFIERYTVSGRVALWEVRAYYAGIGLFVLSSVMEYPMGYSVWLLFKYAPNNLNKRHRPNKRSRLRTMKARTTTTSTMKPKNSDCLLLSDTRKPTI